MKVENQQRNITHFLKKASAHVLSKKHPWISSVDLESHSENKNEAFVFILETKLTDFVNYLNPNENFHNQFENSLGLMIMEDDLSNFVNSDIIEYNTLKDDLNEIKKISRVNFLFKFAIWIEPTELVS